MLSWEDRQATVGLADWEALEDLLAAKRDRLMTDITSSKENDSV
jgi:hypothetical protein